MKRFVEGEIGSQGTYSPSIWTTTSPRITRSGSLMSSSMSWI